jgi:hypothetical protein
MRRSTAQLVATSIRLSDLQFPAARVHVPRTRVLFVHLDNLLHFAKVDRDGKVDGYVAAFLPDELVLLFLRNGALVNAGAVTPLGRMVLSVTDALAHIRQEAERGELTFADAPFEQVAWMFHSCAAPAVPRELDGARPESLFPSLQTEGYTGVVELISRGEVNYLRLESGAFVDGHFAGRDPAVPVAQHIGHLFARDASGSPPELAAALFAATDDIPAQAPSEMLRIYRELFWAIAEAADREAPGQGMKHAHRLRDLVGNVHAVLRAVGTPLDRDAPAVVATESELTAALAEWASQLLDQIEIVAPGSAPDILRAATADERYVLQRAGFYERLPWTVTW